MEGGRKRERKDGRRGREREKKKEYIVHTKILFVCLLFSYMYICMATYLVALSLYTCKPTLRQDRVTSGN